MNYYKQTDLAIKRAERVIDASHGFKEKQEWWIWYRHTLLELLLSNQLRTFNHD